MALSFLNTLEHYNGTGIMATAVANLRAGSYKAAEKSVIHHLHFPTMEIKNT